MAVVGLLNRCNIQETNEPMTYAEYELGNEKIQYSIAVNHRLVRVVRNSKWKDLPKYWTWI